LARFFNKDVVKKIVSTMVIRCDKVAQIFSQKPCSVAVTHFQICHTDDQTASITPDSVIPANNSLYINKNSNTETYDQMKQASLCGMADSRKVNRPIFKTMVQSSKKILIQLNQSLTHLPLFNFTTMKKQVFILIILACCAGTFTFGQAIKGSDPVPVACGTVGPLFPIAGLPYDYTVSFSPTGGTAYWYATTSKTFITADARVATEEIVGGDYVTAATGAYRTPTIDGTTTRITWNSKGLATAAAAAPTVADPPALFVVVEYLATAPDCANNMKVYPIRPIDAFTVDILNLTAAGAHTPLAYGAPDAQCFDQVQSALWQAGGIDGNGEIDYNFGTNVLYYEVIAANFTGQFTPSFQITGLQPTQTALIEWGYTLGTYDHALTLLSADGIATSAAPATTLVTNTSLGVSIYVRVTIENDDFEGLAITPITLAVDAINAESSVDIVNSTCVKPALADFIDTALQNLNPRPTVTPVAPTPFIPKK
jgi:hypothetical protein